MTNFCAGQLKSDRIEVHLSVGMSSILLHIWLSIAKTHYYKREIMSIKDDLKLKGKNKHNI
jgi:hypothetical protein